MSNQKSVIIPYRSSGDGGQELKHCLRSLHNLDVGEVFVIGDREHWFSQRVTKGDFNE